MSRGSKCRTQTTGARAMRNFDDLKEEVERKLSLATRLLRERDKVASRANFGAACANFHILAAQCVVDAGLPVQGDEKLWASGHESFVQAVMIGAACPTHYEAPLMIIDAVAT